MFFLRKNGGLIIILVGEGLDPSLQLWIRAAL